MAIKNVSYGSRGEEVSELQRKLNENGYQLEVDGVFGSKTKSAVQDYQRKNSLDVDGIAGEKTWGSLNKAQNAGGEDAYVNAVQKLQQSQKQMPQYSASYDEQMNALFQKIMNREKFDYNPNQDAMYQQYRDLYVQQGQQAMQDTMGQAAGLTGGYGSSYSQNAGQQAYHAYLQQLNEVVPELYGEAAERYEREGDALYNQYAMLGDLRDTEYSRYQDAYDRYMQEQAFEYQKERDKIADEQWERQFRASQAARYSGGENGDDQDEDEKSGLSDVQMTTLKNTINSLMNNEGLDDEEGAAKEIEKLLDRYGVYDLPEEQYKEILALIEAGGMRGWSSYV